MVDPCEHPDFAAFVDVARLTKVDGGPVTGYSATVLVECVVCAERFHWIGVRAGLSPREPRVSIDGTSLAAPLRPASAPAGWGEDGPGFTVRVR